MPGRLDLRPRQSDHPDPRRTAAGPRLPALLKPPPARPGRRPAQRQVDIALVGHIDSVGNGRIRNTFEAVPDAPATKFTLELQGGKKGLLVNSANLCARKNRALAEFEGHNGKRHVLKPVLEASCKGR